MCVIGKECIITKVYSRSPNRTREISHNFAMMRPISKFQDCALRVGSKYTVYVLLTYTAMESCMSHKCSTYILLAAKYANDVCIPTQCSVYISANTVSHVIDL